jgi:hypothetical protein
MSATTSFATRDNCKLCLGEKERFPGRILISSSFVHLQNRETEQYAKREEVWQQIEELARKKNPQFENLINQMDYLSLSQNNDDFTLNEDDFSNEKIDQYSKDVSRNRRVLNEL